MTCTIYLHLRPRKQTTTKSKQQQPPPQTITISSINSFTKNPVIVTRPHQDSNLIRSKKTRSSIIFIIINPKTSNQNIKKNIQIHQKIQSFSTSTTKKPFQTTFQPSKPNEHAQPSCKNRSSQTSKRTTHKKKKNTEAQRETHKPIAKSSETETIEQQTATNQAPIASKTINLRRSHSNLQKNRFLSPTLLEDCDSLLRSSTGYI